MGLKRSPTTKVSTPSADALLHELQVHQTELESQNETLRQAQIALEESRDRYVNLYEFATVGYLTLSTACLITEINLTGATLFGVNRNKLLNRRPDAYVVTHDRERWQREFVRAIKHEGKASFDLTLIRPDGSLCDVHLDCLRKEHDDEPPTLHITLTDITERKHAESLVERERIRLQTILKMASDGIHILDANGLLVEANEAFLTMLGYDHAAIGKLRVTDWDAQDSWVDIKKRIDRVIAEHGKLVFTTSYRRRDGAVIDVEINASWIEIEGKGYLYSAARDITERKRYEDMLQQKNLELESARKSADKANRAKSEFLSSMSHELRTPLNAVLGFAQLMEAGSPPPTETQRPKIEQILKAGWHLLTLINEILDLTKIESGKVTMSHEPMSLADVLVDCKAMIAAQAALRDIEINFPSSDIPLYVHGDLTGVKQVMINLLSNAIKYNQQGGTITVRCINTRDGKLRVSVTDTGAGLAPEELAQLFQPFNRLGQETGPEEGTGIGLVVTKQLIELMGGTVGVESQVGKGSTFWFELALAHPPNIHSKASEQLEHANRDDEPGQELLFRRTLLYVEDNSANLALIEELISRRSDLKLITATDGPRGIEAARASQPDLILMDLNLPGISGFEALAMLRADPRTADIPVMALSASATLHDIKKGMDAGFCHYVTKPIRVDEFMAALDTTLFASAEPLPVN